MARLVSKRRAAVLAAVAAVLVVAGAGVAVATGGDDVTEQPITGAALERATAAALAETGGGSVTDTEVDDEDSKYEVEVTLANGDQVDVELDENFRVVRTDSDQETDD